MTNMLKKDPFGKLRIDKVRLSDAKLWFINLQQTDGKSYSTIHSIRGVLRPAFQLAVDDDLIRKNPFGFELASVIVNDSVTREAITRRQQRDFLEFVKQDSHYCKYYDGWWRFIGKSIWSMCLPNIIGFTVCSYRRSHLMCVGIHSVPIWLSPV